MERDLTLLVVWTLVTSSAVQAIIHLITWWVLRLQHSETRVGGAMNRRELTLGVKAISRFFFDLLLASLVTWGAFYLRNPLHRELLYLTVTILSIISIYFNINFIFVLHEEDYGQPEDE